VGGDTLWASGYEAYERLTPPMKALLEGLTAIHSSKVQKMSIIVVNFGSKGRI
jgi:poly [ADP-ribose] polymerase/sulfonate dioxygenase